MKGGLRNWVSRRSVVVIAFISDGVVRISFVTGALYVVIDENRDSCCFSSGVGYSSIKEHSMAGLVACIGVSRHFSRNSLRCYHPSSESNHRDHAACREMAISLISFSMIHADIRFFRYLRAQALLCTFSLLNIMQRTRFIAIRDTNLPSRCSFAY